MYIDLVWIIVTIDTIWAIVLAYQFKKIHNKGVNK